MTTEDSKEIVPVVSPHNPQLKFSRVTPSPPPSTNKPVPKNYSAYTFINNRDNMPCKHYCELRQLIQIKEDKMDNQSYLHCLTHFLKGKKTDKK